MFPHLRISRLFGFALILVAAIYFIGSGAARQQSQSGGSVSGSVVDDETHAPIGGVQITLGNFSISRGEPSQPISAQTAADGSFVAHISAGKYLIAADKDGYVSSSREIALNSNGNVTVRFALVRPSSISGRVVDDYDKGIPQIRVDAWAIGYRHGRSRVMHAGTSLTDQTGHFRIDELRPAVYFLGATPHILLPQPGLPKSAEIRDHVSVYSASFYPNGGSLSEASAVALEQREHLTDIDIRMRNTNGYCVTASLPTWLSPGVETAVTISEGSSTELTLGTGLVKSAKDFYFWGVPSGDYTLYATIPKDNGSFGWFASQPLSVDKKNLGVGIVPLEQARDLRGQIAVAKDQIISQRPVSIGLELEPVGRFPFAGEGMFPSFEDGGRFVFHTLYSEQYWLNIVSISPGYYVASISEGSRDVMRDLILVGSGDVTVTVRSDGPSLAGVVTTENGGALPPDTKVILTNESDDTVIRSSSVDQNGHYSFDNTPPGKFKLIALSGLSAADAENPSTIGNFGSQVKEIELAPYSSREVDLHVIATR